LIAASWRSLADYRRQFLHKGIAEQFELQRLKSQDHKWAMASILTAHSAAVTSFGDFMPIQARSQIN
jgi:hypothetical protein